MSATSLAFVVTDASTGATIDLSSINILMVTTPVNGISGANSQILYDAKGEVPVTYDVTESPATIAAASNYLIALTFTSTGVGFYLNPDHIISFVENGTGSTVLVNLLWAENQEYVVNEDPSAIEVLIDAVVTTGIFSSTSVHIGTNVSPISLTSATSRTFSTYTTTSVATATNLSSITVHQAMTGASAVNTVEVAQFIATTAVQTGNWINAVLAKIDFTTTGYITGLAGVVCGELDMPSTAPAGGAGTYTVFEAELNMASVTTVPVSAMCVNVWGSHAASFDTSGYLFDITGLTKASGKVFQDNTATAATQALRIRVNGTAYYMMLTSVGA
jgi:hypothetical protein